ncbi:hypothetical protein GUITHDRAFT_113579 [Guillardia theta CCMP2712]|uniref:Uncharacterized protein n=1 Tax=Guillardia theta (strain CCMP2712) TaxID=905079 RepID=L1IVR8_GUITC|nr:hypothetical protein GUITHDRAFT_113579 [Guillardia theta CCMP2712]EKX40343.1 hypothetical protein GUITHDRAFT_113579 [Guillardia theta CCMP2712]|eukprot:XP_005827323.1 hypothetical protein GUITHDRAFT_113579 [Guillardia theta CCMP2712]
MISALGATCAAAVREGQHGAKAGFESPAEQEEAELTAELNPLNARGNRRDLPASEEDLAKARLEEARKSGNSVQIAYAEIDVAEAKLKAANEAGNQRVIAAAEVKLAEAKQNRGVEVAKAKLAAANKAGDVMLIAEAEVELAEAKQEGGVKVAEAKKTAGVEVAKAKLAAANKAGDVMLIAEAEVELAEAKQEGGVKVAEAKKTAGVEVAKAKLAAANKAGDAWGIAAAEVEVAEKMKNGEIDLAEAKKKGAVGVAKAKLAAAKKAGEGIAAAEVEVAEAKHEGEVEVVEAKLRGEVEVAKAKLHHAQTQNQTHLIDDLQRSVCVNESKLAEFRASLPWRSDTAVLDAISLKYSFALEGVVDSLKKYLDQVLGSRTGTFSERNPIDKVVANATQEAGIVTCMIEACSGSGKSLCAADYFVRNPKTSLYCLFGYVQEQDLYLNVQGISHLLNVAIDLDLQACDRRIDFLDPTKCEQQVLTIDVLAPSWNVLGVLGYLFGKTKGPGKVSVGEAKLWTQKGDLWVFVDEAIPRYQGIPCRANAIWRLLFLKRILRNAGFHCIMLGTNTLVMNFNNALQQTTNSRGKNQETIKCITHRALPPMILQSDEQRDILKQVFGEEMIGGLLDNVNPLLCHLFFKYGCGGQGKDSATLFRDLANPVLAMVRADKKNLKDASLYCMFQIATHESMCQAHILQGFGLLNAWPRSQVPARGSSESIIRLHRIEDKIEMNGIELNDLTSKFPPGWVDPITVAICAGGGRPFGRISSLEVLRRIHRDALKPMDDPTAVDALRQDGNLLESFGAVVVMLASWAEPEDILSTLSHHCGREVGSKVKEVLGSVKDETSAEEFRKVLTQCFCNLIPLRDSEGEIPNHQAFGYYIRCMDKRRRDGQFAGPVHGPEGQRSMRGAAEFKNWRQAVGQSRLKKFVNKLAIGGHDLLLFMAPALAEYNAEDILPKRAGWHTVVSGGEKECRRHRILILMEVGLATKPFSEPSMQQDDMGN